MMTLQLTHIVTNPFKIYLKSMGVYYFIFLLTHDNVCYTVSSKYNLIRKQ